MSRTKITLMLAAVLLLPSLLRAGLLEYGYYGTRDFLHDGQTSAMMVAGVSLRSGSVIANPALSSLSRGFRAQVSGDLSWRRETRSIEAFDSYSNTVGLTAYSLNSETYFTVKSFSLSYCAKVDGIPPLALAVSLRPEYDFRYYYQREVRDAFFRITESYLIESKGLINGYSASLSCSPLPWIAAGLGLTRLSGKQDYASEIQYEDPTIYDEVFTMDNKLRGNRVNAGLWGAVTSRLSLGATWRSPAKLKLTMHQSLTQGNLSAMLDTSGTVKYPAEYTFGISYRPSNTFPATVTLEYSYIPWNKLSDDLVNGNVLTAVNRYSLGVTHKISDALPLHFGISFENSYQSNGIGLARAGLGTEVPFLNVTTQVGCNIGRRSYNYGQAFRNSSRISVTETFADLVLTFSIK